MRILITGSRNWTDVEVIRQALEDATRWTTKVVTVVHGGARGADTIAGQLATETGLEVEVHWADWDEYGKAAGHIRNREMVEAGADVCLAFPLGESRGTRGCMALARAAGIPVIEHLPA